MCSSVFLCVQFNLQNVYKQFWRGHQVVIKSILESIIRAFIKSHTKWEPKIICPVKQNVDKSYPSLVSFVCKYTFLSIIPLNIYWYSILRMSKPRLSLLTQNDIFYKANTIRQNLKFISCFILSRYLPLPRVMKADKSWASQERSKTFSILMFLKWAAGCRIVKNSKCIWGVLQMLNLAGGRLTFAFIQVTSQISNIAAQEASAACQKDIRPKWACKS